MDFVQRASTSRARRIDKEEALCRYASRFFFSRGFLATWKRFFVFPLSHRPGCRPVVSGAKRRLLVSPRRFSHENHREAFRAVRNTPQRAPRRPHNLLHTMKTICESCCDSPATLVACGREATVLCGTCDTPRYAPAA